MLKSLIEKTKKSIKKLVFLKLIVFATLLPIFCILETFRLLIKKVEKNILDSIIIENHVQVVIIKGRKIS